MKKKFGALLVAFFLIVLMIGLDQVTKWCVVENIQLGQNMEIIHNFFWITYLQNTGAGFSLFEGFGIWFFSAITIVALIVVVYLYLTSTDTRYDFCYIFIFAGALGNFIDRLTLGYVRDFFSFNLLGWYFPVFNVADICITCGFAALIALYLFDDYKEKKQWKK